MKTDLKTWCIENDRQDILKEWDFSLNGDVTPESIACKSGYKAWWICSNGHSYKAMVSNRVRLNNSCPYCSGRLAIIGENDLKTWCIQNDRQDILAEWDVEKNKDIEEYKAGSSVKVSWICKSGHEYEAKIYNRTTKNTGCPYCCIPPKKVLAGFNDLETWCIENERNDILEEWDYSKNQGLLPKMVFHSGTKQVWWRCTNGHEYKTKIYSRTNAGTGCPYCAGQKVSEENSLMFQYPDIAKEWNYEKNGNLTPYDVGKGCIKKVWWKCQYGHEWQATVNGRVCGTNCPQCSASGTSITEQGIAYYLKKSFKVKQREKINSFEVDVYLPNEKIGIEYDGSFYHSSEYSKKREKDKDLTMSKMGIRLLRIKEVRDSNVTVKQEGDIFYFNSDNYLGKNYEQVLICLLKYIEDITGKTVYKDVNIKRDVISIREHGSKILLNNSIEATFPKLVQEWNYDKNGELLPSMFSRGSTQKVWWKCINGHEWIAPISRRVQGSGCPYCVGRIAQYGENDLETKFPQLYEEWDFKKNETVDVSSIPVGSHSRVWWKCSKCGYEWQCSLYSRTQLKTGCPKCARGRIESAHFRRVKNLDTGEIFNSVKEAAKKYNITAANISACCSGRRNVAGGYHWGREEEL
ncbi:zinc-ribbon domain-containing protein [Butyrivibrio sp. XB500-5]|uniref:zinc-ribbon domain-containing protein n=1 Tax=Butyrivibrio sp. XB500-5 TaxID=2364880 RepID=UPI001314D798|nr:zinc-ribbon domain-containing protein [Butyrivibrio sp. XB500-5]